MSKNIKQLVAALATHPGEVLKDELDARNLKQKEFAQTIGLQPTQLNEIIKGKRGINAANALVIGEALGMDPAYWNNLQSSYELDTAKLHTSTQERIEAIGKWKMIAQYLPEKFFRRQGVTNGDPVSDIPVIKDIYQVAHLEELPGILNKQEYAMFRKSEKLNTDKIAIVGWVKLANWVASKKEVGAFKAGSKKTVVASLKTILTENRHTISRCDELLSSVGIKLIILPNPDKCPVDGISFWSGDSPAIGLTLRHNRLDNYAFTLFHELGHTYLHLANDKNARFIDLEKDDEARTKEEREANDFAGDEMIDYKQWNIFLESRNRLELTAILDFARKQNVHPAIIKGRLCHDFKSYSLNIPVDNTIQ